ncbi:MAG TPA: tRNA (N6-threonylcarbamoyladenosine(37)-N6)-methyltransferase TrmO [Acidimicrobiales bacterium]|jgi:tRNA-Thr(GGU) m(6)t(6)A37 methyltransferase TsaA|nr:tRNA (N6-threonylcarbamoyladenosine(37)-N6)-methyltransferase TrmO [Acidimicrobiales bacterium]
MPSCSSQLETIGVVRSGYRSHADTPVQSSLNTSVEGVIQLDGRFADALLGLDEFDYAWILSWLGTEETPAPKDVALRQVPFLLQGAPRPLGILATRGPRRINPIGLSLVRILEVGPATIRFGGVDLVDGTPVVDIKPYVVRFDRPPETGADIRCGWFDTVALPEAATPASLDPNRE